VGVATVTMMSNKTNDEGKVTEISEFHWSPETIGYVDASFFWGYIVTQLPGGFLGEQAAS
jgi:ACS family sodium-dependent inorganic phosphate cotransporter-like MFS transporter 6/7/8